MTTQTLHRPGWLFAAVSLGHLVVDLFNGMAPVLLVFLSAHVMRLTNTQIGLAISIFQLSGSLSQPVFGLFGDRGGGRWIGAGGVVWMVALLAASMAAAQTTHSYTLMLIPLVLSAFGSAAFHPVGAMHAAECHAGRAATNTSMFFFVGSLGAAIGPAVAGFLLDQTLIFGGVFARVLGPTFAGHLVEPGTTLPVVLIISLFSLPVPLLMALAIPGRQAHAARRATAHATLDAAKTKTARLPMHTMALFLAVIALRSVVSPGLIAFVPALFQSKGWDATQYGFVTGMVWIGGGLAGVFLGILADRYDSRIIIAISLLLSAPFIYLLSTATTALAYAAALLMGALSGGPHALLVLLAQGLLPKRRGLASGAIMGFMFSTGAIGTLLVGRLADAIGLPAAFQATAVLIVITGVLSFWLPSDQKAQARAIEAARPVDAIVGTTN